MIIRQFRESDAKDVSDIIRLCFLTLNLGLYTKEAIELQTEANSATNLIKNSTEVKYYVVIDKNHIIGIGGYDKQKVRTMFIAPSYQRRGVGKTLLQRILKDAKKDGIEKLESWSTHYAESFYARNGFEKKGTVEYPGIQFVRMVIDL